MQEESPQPSVMHSKPKHFQVSNKKLVRGNVHKIMLESELNSLKFSALQLVHIAQRSLKYMILVHSAFEFL